MKIKLFISILCVFFTLPFFSIQRPEAAHLHAILVTDTITGEEENLSTTDFMRRETEKIAAFTGLELNRLCFDGFQTRVDNVLEHLMKLKVNPDDIILIHFAMHGSRTVKKQSKWPDLNFSLDIASLGKKGYLDFEVVNEMAKSKNPRLLLSIADCNNLYRLRSSRKDSRLGATIEIHFPLPNPPCQKNGMNANRSKSLLACHEDSEIQVYRDLFLKPKGSVIVSTSSPGMAAIKNPQVGGVFTIQFINALRICSSREISIEPEDFSRDFGWADLLKLTSRMTKDEMFKIMEYDESVQYEIQLN